MATRKARLDADRTAPSLRKAPGPRRRAREMVTTCVCGDVLLDGTAPFCEDHHDCADTVRSRAREANCGYVTVSRRELVREFRAVRRAALLRAARETRDLYDAAKQEFGDYDGDRVIDGLAKAAAHVEAMARRGRKA